MAIDKNTPPPGWDLDCDGEEDDAEGQTWYCIRSDTETPQRDTPEEAIAEAHAIVAHESAPAVLAFAERVAAWRFGSGESRRHAWHAWVAYVDSGGTLGLDAWVAAAITEAARTGAPLPGESEGT